MFCDRRLYRRDMFRLAGGFAGALALARLQPAAAQVTPSETGGALPARGEFVVRGGGVLTMDASLGDPPGGDVHVRDGGRDMIVMRASLIRIGIYGALRCG
jgi:hypothetical protein